MKVREDDVRRLVIVEMSPAELGALVGYCESGQTDSWWGQVSAVELVQAYLAGLAKLKVEHGKEIQRTPRS